jgi:CelD/BcsL family acetyltransferase involved in cellulose biosynthesis
LETAIISDEAAFEALVGEWTQLFELCQRRTAFQSFAWNRCWWRHHQNCGSLAVITVREKGQLVGLIAFLVQRGWGAERILPIGFVSFAYFGPLVLPDRDDVAQAIAIQIATRFRHGLLHIPYYQNRDEALGMMLACLNTLGWNSCSWVRNVCHYVSEAGGYSVLMARKSSKVRYNLKRERKKLEEVGTVEIRLYQGSEINEDLVARIAAIQSRSWLARRGQESLGSPYYRELLPCLGRSLLADVYVLTLQGNDVAFVLNYHTSGENICINIGFDEVYAHLSPGKVLMNCVVKTILDRGDSVLDFYCGQGEYKRFWANRSKYAMEMVAWRGAVPYLHSWFPARLRQLVKGFPKLKTAVKQMRARWRLSRAPAETEVASKGPPATATEQLDSQTREH